jgi:uncharacterized protein YjiS (DUF1127 family)
MTQLTLELMTNLHAMGFIPRTLARVRGTLQLWRQRQAERRQLAQFTEQDRHDVGLSWSDVENEVRKPFWRA